ncbi:MAG: hypothetical protein ABL899_02185, partial [Nitrospira sp.]
MKNILLIIILFLGLAVGYFFYNFKIEKVCFGDVCPDNGGTYVFYRESLTKDQCIARGGNPIVGIG